MKYAYVLLLLVFLGAACTPGATLTPNPNPTAILPTLSAPTSAAISPTDQPAAGEITLDLLRNFTYVLEASGGLQVALTDGSFKVNDTAQNMVVSGQLVKSALGDLNGDGIQDAAVTLAANFGGSGTFHQLIAVLSQDGKAVQAADLFLEDRLGEKQLTIADGLITLDTMRHGPHDPLCCPSEHAVIVYRYQAGQIEVVSDKIITAAPAGSDTALPNQITLDSPQNGAVVGSSLVLRGKTSQIPFEKNLVVRVYDSGGGLVMQKPLTVLGEYGGPGSFETNIQLPADLKGSGRLDVVDIDMADGQPRGLASVAFNIQ